MANKAGTKRRGSTRGRATTARGGGGGGGKRASTKTRAASHKARSSAAGRSNASTGGSSTRTTKPTARAKTKLRRGPGDVGKSRGGAKSGGVPMRP
jgi:hypothetical protein